MTDTAQASEVYYHQLSKGQQFDLLISPSDPKLNKLANERHFSMDDVCAHYGVLNVNQLNQKQMQEVFDKYKRV